MLAERLMARVLSGDTFSLSAPWSSAEPWFCTEFASTKCA
jgi:hypothetical protein